MKTDRLSVSQQKLVRILAVSSVVSLLFFGARVLATQGGRYGFLPWNLFLAWLPLLFGWLLCRRLKSYTRFDAQTLLLGLAWLGFLPNAFYLVSDLIHASPTGEISQLFDIVMFVSFVWNGFLLGFISLFMVHKQLRKQLGRLVAYGVTAVTLLLCSYAIYLGRYLRWNSWDLLFNPFGVVFDISDPFISPSSHPQAFTTTIMFFVLLVSIYAVIYELIGLSRGLLSDK